MRLVEYNEHLLTLQPKNPILSFNTAMLCWQLEDLRHADDPSKYTTRNFKFDEKALYHFNNADKGKLVTLEFFLMFSSFLEDYASHINDLNAAYDLTRALQLLCRADAIYPNNAEIHYQKGRKYATVFPFSHQRKIENLCTAINSFKVALSIEPTQLRSLNGMAAAHVMLGWCCGVNCLENYYTAIEICRNILAIDPNNLDAYRNMAEAYMELFQLKNDESDLERCSLNLTEANRLETGSVSDLESTYKDLKMYGYSYYHSSYTMEE